MEQDSSGQDATLEVGPWAALRRWPRDPAASHRYLCSPDHPMPKGAPGQWAHTNLKSDGSDSDYYDGYICKDCGHWFRCEVPE